MATLAIGLLASGLASGAGFGAGTGVAIAAGIVGSAVGGYIDQTLLMPAIFGNKTAPGGLTLDDLRVQTGSEGSPRKFLVGESNRIAGTVIWLGRLTQADGGSDGIGKGGGTQQSITTYSVSVAIALCEGPIEGIDTIWADTKVLYTSVNNGTTTTSETGTVNTVTGTRHIFTATGLTEPDGFYDGGTVTWTSGLNLGLTYSIDTYASSTITLGTFTGLTIAPGDTFKIRPYGLVDPRYSNVTIYGGTSDQMPDPLMEGIEGIGNVPAYRGVAYIVFKDLQLAEFGNRLPQFSFLVRQKTGATPAYAIDRIMSRTPLDPRYWDVSALTSMPDELPGYVITGPQKIDRVLEPIMTTFNITAKEESGVIKFFQRSLDDVITIDPDDLAAHEPDTDTPRMFSVSDPSDFDLPAAVEVVFVDPTRQHQQSSMREHRVLDVGGSVVTINMPMTISALQARVLGRRAMWGAWAERQAIELYLPPKYVALQEADLLSLTYKGTTWLIRVTSIDQGWNFIQHVKGVVEQPQVIDPPANADSGGLGITNPYNPQDLVLLMMNLPPLRDKDINIPGMYWTVCTGITGATFKGCTLYASADGGTTYSACEFTAVEGTIGTTNNTLGPPPSLGVRDDANYVDVTLLNGDLTSKSFEEITHGANLAIVGTEILAFESAVLQAPLQYRLTGLWRGLRDTTDVSELYSHTIGEQFVLLTGAGIIWHEMYRSRIGRDMVFKAVPVYKSVDLPSPQDFTLTAQTTVPFRPAPVTRGTTGTTDILMQWQRRGRWLDATFGTGVFPNDEPFEQYHLDIYEWTGSVPGALLRSVTVNNAQSYTYLAADQTTDGRSTPGDPIYVSIYQQGSISRGNISTATI